MRLLIGLSFVFVVIIATGIWANHSLKTSTEELLQNIDKIEQNLQSNQWDEAHLEFLELENIWGGKSKWWPAILDHQEIDNIEFTMARAGAYIEQKSTPLAWGHLSELRLMMKHIPEKEALKIINIF